MARSEPKRERRSQSSLLKRGSRMFMCSAIVAFLVPAMGVDNRCLVPTAAAIAQSATTDSRARTTGPVFGYSNSAGDAILAEGLRDAHNSQDLDRAVCSEGRILEVKFARYQAASLRSTGRNTSGNFEQDEGLLFAVVNGVAKGDDSCLLTSQAFLEGKKALQVTPRYGPCQTALSARIPDQQKRGIAKCFSIAQFSDGSRMLAVEYQRKGNDLLAAVVLLTNSAAYAELMPATLGEDAWRVDDGGEFDASGMNVLFVLYSADGTWEVGLGWVGTEGDNLSLYRTVSGHLEKIVDGYRYTAPS